MHDPDCQALNLFVLNPHLEEEIDLTVSARCFANLEIEKA